MNNMGPKRTIKIKFCKICGRDDRYIDLKENHFYEGKKCPGKIYAATYNLNVNSIYPLK